MHGEQSSSIIFKDFLIGKYLASTRILLLLLASTRIFFFIKKKEREKCMIHDSTVCYINQHISRQLTLTKD